ncbi:hypothetical protein FHW79_006417 [Azospirillum sp. OGB3]|uniref:hypothetical protein n=1 Tax=Azospirillum sp. OGB3 TaxID=2587012 RepID=UPI00160642C0|nr:hypothetical protein [Azospirillum sp. OGB3]MBB3268742.1 hypothetical protein [Azospirillum sp. OGB3]
MSKLVDAIAEGVPAWSAKDELVRREARQEELRLARAKAQGNTPDTQTEATELIQSLIEVMVLTPEDGTLQVDLHGALAGILALRSGTRKADPVSGAGLAEQTKLVAGARTHRELTLPPVPV